MEIFEELEPLGLYAEKVGCRVYFRGNAYPWKDLLKRLGGKWDQGELSWWMAPKEAKEAVSPLLSAAGGASAVSRPGTERGRWNRGCIVGKVRSPALGKPATPASLPATEAQVRCALELSGRITRLGGWYGSGIGQAGGGPADRDDLKGYTMREIREYIESLKGEL